MHSFMVRICLLAAALLPAATAAKAANISGTISSTLTITTNSQLVGDVRCTVTNAPCIQFGASGITLNLNGHTMTGNGGVNSCTLAFGERAIHAAANNVSILGPGIVRQFNERGIAVVGNGNRVEQVVVLSICFNGIQVDGSNNKIKANTVDLSGLNGFAGGIAVFVGESNLFQKNEVAGAPVAIEVFSNNNKIAENNASGVYCCGPATNIGGTLYPASIGIFLGPSTGNQIRNNQALGNTNLDIFDANSPGANVYTHNLCATSNVGGTNICEILAIAGHTAP